MAYNDIDKYKIAEQEGVLKMTFCKKCDDKIWNERELALGLCDWHIFTTARLSPEELSATDSNNDLDQFVGAYKARFNLSDDDIEDMTQWWEENYKVKGYGAFIGITWAILKEVFPSKIEIELRSFEDHQKLAQLVEKIRKNCNEI